MQLKLILASFGRGQRCYTLLYSSDGCMTARPLSSLQPGHAGGQGGAAVPIASMVWPL